MKLRTRAVAALAAALLTSPLASIGPAGAGTDSPRQSDPDVGAQVIGGGEA